MDYVIGNKTENLYIRIQDGKAVTCKRSQAQHFDYAKAGNIRKNLPKALQKVKFTIFAVSDDSDPVKLDMKSKAEVMANVAKEKSQWQTEQVGNTRKIYLKATTYQIPQNVHNWASRIRSCDSLSRDAKRRKTELEEALSNSNKELTNVEHTIELESLRNMYDGYRYYKALREVLIRRRQIKDELTIVETIANINLPDKWLDCSKQVDDQIRFMENRRFEFRQIDDKFKDSGKNGNEDVA